MLEDCRGTEQRHRAQELPGQSSQLWQCHENPLIFAPSHAPVLTANTPSFLMQGGSDLFTMSLKQGKILLTCG